MKVPDHLGIIMDGNGRWATSRGLNRSKGHFEGLETTRKIVRAASESGVRYLSLYVFSTENWKRSTEEVGFLMGLVARHLEKELDFYNALGLRIVHSGERVGLSSEVLRALDRAVQLTSTHKGMVVNLALNYGGQDELLRAIGRWSEAGSQGRPSTGELKKYLDAPFLPDIDLVIRTGGEFRLSNFFLWQTAYAEFIFSDRLWPDFTEDDLRAAFRDYAERDRRFGSAPTAVARNAGRRAEARPHPRG